MFIERTVSFAETLSSILVSLPNDLGPAAKSNSILPKSSQCECGSSPHEKENICIG